MAYNVAANLRPVRPGAAFLQGRDNAVQNALVQRRQAQDEQSQQFAQENTLFQQDRARAQDQRQAAMDQAAAAEQAKAGEADERTQLHNYLSHLSRLRENPDAFSATAQKMLATPLFQKYEIGPEDLTPDEIDQVLPMFAAQAGVAPEAQPDQFEQVEGPRGSVMKRNLRTKELSQVVGPDNTESPVYNSQPKAPSGYQFTPNGTLTAIPGGPADPNTASTKDDSRTFAKADKLRDEFNTQSKDFVAVNDAYNVVQETAKSPSAAGDLSLIFAYMKMLDPTSVVREQEFANAQNAAGVPDRIRNSYNKVLSGQRLNPNQRQDFIGQAKNLYNTRKARNDTLVKRYSEIAKRNNVNPDDVVGDMSVMMGGEEPPAGPGVPTATGPNGQKLILLDGQWKPYDPKAGWTPRGR